MATLAAAGMRTPERATLYERLGGAPAITAAVVSLLLLCNSHKQPEKRSRWHEMQIRDLTYIVCIASAWVSGHDWHTKAFDNEASLQDIFYEKVLADARINYFFHDVDMKKQRSHQVYFVLSHGCFSYKIAMPRHVMLVETHYRGRQKSLPVCMLLRSCSCSEK